MTLQIKLKNGTHTFRKFDGISATFGAELSDYPSWDDIPNEYTERRHPTVDIVRSLFFSGGKLADHGKALSPHVSADEFYSTLNALLRSFEPKHEVKEATVAMLIDAYTIEAAS